MKIYIVIPVFNEEKHIKNVAQSFKKSKLPIVVVDDGSSDNTYEIAKKIREITLLKHDINIGKGAALKTGCDWAFKNGADAVITADGDGQHDPAEIDRFVKALENYEIVFGSRNMEYGVPIMRFMGNKFASVIIVLMFNLYVSDLLCGYRAFNKKAYKKLRWNSPGYGVETEMAIRTAKYKLKHTEVPVKTVYLDAVKGVTIIDAIGILANVIMWRINI